MNAKARVVIDRFPTARLPPEIRERLHFGAEVRIEVQPVDAADADPLPLSTILERAALRRDATDDPVARIRALREEWNARDARNARAGDAE